MNEEHLKEDRPKRVAFYLRVSTEDQTDKYGISAQLEALKNLVKSKGKNEQGKDRYMEPTDKYIYIDNGISGITPLNERPGFAKLQEDLAYAPEDNPPFDIVAVYKLDRFARKLKILLEVVDFFEGRKMDFISANETIDTSTPFGKAMIGILGVIAELERDTIQIRTSQGRLEAIKKGIVMGSTSRYGYIKNSEKKLEIIKEEAEIVSQIFKIFVWESRTTQYIADYLKAKEILTPSASAEIRKKTKARFKRKNSSTFWLANMVDAILKDEIYLGKYYYNKRIKGKLVEKKFWKLSPYKHPSIIDTPLFRLAWERYKRMNELRSTYGTHAKRTYLLSGLLKCASCFDPDIDTTALTWSGERKIIDRVKSKFSYIYKCSRKNLKKSSIGCHTIPLPAEQIEEYVLKFIKDLLKNPKDVFDHQMTLRSRKLEIEALRTKKLQLEKILNGYPKRKNNILFQNTHGYITRQIMESELDKLELARKKSQEELEATDEQLNKVTLSEGYMTSFKAFNEAYQTSLENKFNDPEETKRMLSLIISEIVIFSRPVTSKDLIAGRKKRDQEIPYKILIRLRLPHNILQDLTKETQKKFGVVKDQWWAPRDLNPQPTRCKRVALAS